MGGGGSLVERVSGGIWGRGAGGCGFWGVKRLEWDGGCCWGF